MCHRFRSRERSHTQGTTFATLAPSNWRYGLLESRPGPALHPTDLAPRCRVRRVRHPHRGPGHRRQCHSLQRRQHPAPATAAVREAFGTGVDCQQRRGRTVGPDDTGWLHAGPERREPDNVVDCRVFRVLRRRGQPSEWAGGTRTVDRRARLEQLLRRARREPVVWPGVHRRRERVERPEGGDARLRAVGTALQHAIRRSSAPRSSSTMRRTRSSASCRPRSTSQPSSRRAAASTCTSRFRSAQKPIAGATRWR